MSNNPNLRPTCIKCGNGSFQSVQVNKVIPSNLVGTGADYCFVCCQNCGGVAGVIPYRNPVTLLEKLAESLRIKL